MYRNEEYNQEYYEDYEHTGDPQLDLEYERCPGVFEDVKIFLVNFRAAIKQGAIFDIQTMYESTFPALSDKYYFNTEWPNETEIAPLLEGDPVFKILYKELYYRHIHARLQGGPTSDHRFNSFFNYCDLFNLILTPNEPFLLKLPDIWLWELIDEFVYQFQNFALYRARLLDNDKDMEVLSSSNNNVWSILCVLNVLHSLVEISHIKEQLEVASQGGDAHTVAGEFGEHSLYKMLGFFSLIGLLRLHSILGDYYQAIKVLEPIEIHNKSQNSPISACQISTSYYVGFAYMMMRRYTDAIRTFSSILLHIQRTKQLYSTKSYQNDQINKQSDQMYHLLAICLVLHPQCIDESIQQVLREKNYNENMCKMQCGEMEAFKNFFTFACPKFVSPCPRTRESKDDKDDDESIKDPFEHQLEIFMEEVRQQIKLPTIRSYLKLYTTLPIEKLASFMDLSSEESKLLINLLCFKHKMKNMVWTKGSSGLQGIFQSGSELDFYIDNDMVHIADTKVAHRYGDFFIRKILKFEDLNRRLHNIKMK